MNHTFRFFLGIILLTVSASAPLWGQALAFYGPAFIQESWRVTEEGRVNVIVIVATISIAVYCVIFGVWILDKCHEVSP